MQKCHRPFLHNFSPIRDQTNLQKSHQLFYTLFHQFGTKQTCINLIKFFTQFFINSGANRLAEISPTVLHTFSSTRDQTDLQKSHQLFCTIFHQFGAKQTCRGLINLLAEFSLNSSAANWEHFHRWTSQNAEPMTNPEPLDDCTSENPRSTADWEEFDRYISETAEPMINSEQLEDCTSQNRWATTNCEEQFDDCTSENPRITGNWDQFD
jgi:hypothetical protein